MGSERRDLNPREGLEFRGIVLAVIGRMFVECDFGAFRLNSFPHSSL